MAIIKTFSEIYNLIPTIDSTKNGVGGFSSVSEETIKSNEIYALLYNNKKNNVYTLYKVAFVVYKAPDYAYLLINNIHSAVSSSTPSVKVKLDNIPKTKFEQWGFNIDEVGVNVKATSINDEYTVYFGTKFNDFINLGNKLKEKKEEVKELVTETVYV